MSIMVSDQLCHFLKSSDCLLYVLLFIIHKTGKCIVVLLPSDKPYVIFFTKMDNQKWESANKDKSEAKEGKW